MIERITCAPGDPRSATPAWVCITNQPINPFHCQNTLRTKEETKAIVVRKRTMLEAGFITLIMCEKVTGLNRESIINMIKRGDISPRVVDGVKYLCPPEVEAVREHKVKYAKKPYKPRVAK